ncbi:MAG: RidA family protein [Ottowia sp.]|uniref:RidA family protein n=1 Tax=Ottowia sp. TaxID=1898956 RepID=UPI0039E546CE
MTPTSTLPTRLAFAAAALAALAGCATTGGPAEVVRHKIPSSSFPIAAAIEVPASATRVLLSGKTPPTVDKTKAPTDPAAYGGDTKGQTIGVLKAIQEQLAGLGLSMKDVVKMQVYLVGDPAKGGKMDFAGFMEGYTQFFGDAAKQPGLPTRSTFQVAALANPAYLVEIEVEAVRPAK